MGKLQDIYGEITGLVVYTSNRIKPYESVSRRHVIFAQQIKEEGKSIVATFS